MERRIQGWRVGAVLQALGPSSWVLATPGSPGQPLLTAYHSCCTEQSLLPPSMLFQTATTQNKLRNSANTLF